MRHNEVIDPIVDSIISEWARKLPSVPNDLEQDWKTEGGWAGFLAGASSGAWIGAHFGIAGGPLGAIAATVPGAIFFGLLGYLGGQKAGEKYKE